MEANLLAQASQKIPSPLSTPSAQHNGSQLPLSSSETPFRPPDDSISQHDRILGASRIDPSRSRMKTETLRKYGKSATEHFALTLKASTENVETVSEESCKRTFSASSNSSIVIEEQSRDEKVDHEDALSRESKMLIDQSPLHDRHSRLLIDAYFELAHPIWPIVIESETRQLFSQIRLSDDSSEPIRVAQLYLMMSLACRHLEGTIKDVQASAVDAIAISEDFYRKAKSYIHANAFSECTGGMLQALLLLALYQQDTMQFVELYLTTGHAARVAQSLGYHISRPDNASIKPEYRELRRRLWWACFCLDR